MDPYASPHSPHKAKLHHAANRHHQYTRTREPVPATDYDTSNPYQIRKYLRSYGLIPPVVESFETQAKRCLGILAQKPNSLEKYMYLTHLRATNVHLFYRLLANNIKDLTPIIYTPTVGEACQKWSHIWTQPEGLYLSWEDKGHLHSIIQNWHHPCEITVVTDGSRILGLGDLGVGGMGIPVGKLQLYVACAGIRPDATLPLTIDLGTNNESLLADPLYMGSRRKRVTNEEEREFLDEMMAALTEKWPGIVIQFEDFKNAFPCLDRYKDHYTCFNDDIQGTGAVVLGGFINAAKRTKIHPRDQRAVFFGAGSAGVGVAKQIVEFFMKDGNLTEDEARRCFWLVDSKGLVTDDRGDTLAPHKTYFSRPDNDGKQYKTLLDVVNYVKPTVLMGMSTIGGAFTEDVLRRMADFNDAPIIFPLSNPSDNSECTLEEAIKYTDGKAIFASGSPFPDYEYKGRICTGGQGNNMYVFPGIGLGTIVSRAVNVSNEMVYASAASLSEALTPEEVEKGWLYPDINRIREVSVVVTRGVIRGAQRSKVDRELNLRSMSDKELDEYISQRMYDPEREKDLLNEELYHITSSLLDGRNGA